VHVLLVYEGKTAIQGQGDYKQHMIWFWVHPTPSWSLARGTPGMGNLQGIVMQDILCRLNGDMTRGRRNTRMAQITVVGTGYVGLTTGVCFAHMGHSVVCLDIDAAKVARLQSGEIPIYEPGLGEIAAESVAAGRLRFSDNYAEALSATEFVFIAVGTPTAPDGYSADMRFVHAAAREIARTLPTPAIIVNKSTSPIGTGNHLAEILAEARPEFAPWQVVSNPEFLREGSAVHDCLHPARIVLGASDPIAAGAVAVLYEMIDAPIISTDLPTAEMIKYASNAFLATRISFINEVARICDRLDADVSVVAEGMGLDPRIGPSFLQAGLGYGGSCFPKDVSALSHMAASAGLHPQLLRTVSTINDDQRTWIVDRIQELLGSLENATIALWGLTFKPHTDDLRHAPALDIARRLTERGARIRAYDPIAGEAVSQMGLDMTICPTAMGAVTGADVLLLATEWDEFLAQDWRQVARLMRGTLFIDGRNCVDPQSVFQAGLRYHGVGRRNARTYSHLRAIPA
jgi:UDPglucose 6-dehydrogenase